MHKSIINLTIIKYYNYYVIINLMEIHIHMTVFDTSSLYEDFA